MASLSGQEIVSVLFAQGILLLPAQGGTLAPRTLALLTPLQRGVVAKHLEQILMALTTTLAQFVCPACASLCWVAPARPQIPCYWSCGSCVAWGEMRNEHRITTAWRFSSTVH
jgi:hypothetical protein